jgi:hypothetical protein
VESRVNRIPLRPAPLGFERSQLETVDDYVGADNPVRFIDAFVDELDLAAAGFIRVAPKATGRPGYAPGDLLKLYIYGYLNRVRSSRRLEGGFSMWGFLGELIWSDSALFLWKTLATAATAAFGVYGLGVNARDDHGRLTKQGKVVLGGLIVSALITGVIQTGEFVDKRQAAADQLTRSQQVSWPWNETSIHYNRCRCHSSWSIP